jgi:predicted nucleotidyltransferase
MTSEAARPDRDGTVPGRDADASEPDASGTAVTQETGVSQEAEALGRQEPMAMDTAPEACAAAEEGAPEKGAPGVEGVPGAGAAGPQSDESSLAAARAAASPVQPVQVTETGYLIERPDVAQAVCVDHDVRRINLTALRPVAAAHPYPLLFSSVLGAHLYGFPSTDSDIDLHGVHLLPAVQVVGLRHGPQTVERCWLHEEVMLDLLTHDIGKFLRLMLRRNGYVLEQLLSPLVVTTSPVHQELISLAQACLTRQHAHHYRTSAQEQWELYQQSGQLKPLLYTFRLLLTGIHVVRSGALIAHLPTLLELVSMSPAYLGELIELKATGEYNDVPVLPERVSDDVVKLQVELDLAEDDSSLPGHPGAEGALHDLLVRLRLEGTAAYRD